MQTARRFLHLPIASILLGAMLLPQPATAQNQNTVQSGDITVHYNALPTRSLSADVAHQYGITRSASRGLLNVAVRRGADGADKAIPATVTAAATNLNGQRQDLKLREVREGEAIYYLAEVRVADKETLTFDIEVKADGAPSPLRATFQQQFFVEP